MERRTETGRRYRRSTRLILLCGAVMAGLGIARMLQGLPVFWVWLSLAGAVLTYRPARTLSLYLMIVFGFSLGWWRGSIYMQHVRSLAEISKQKITVTGTALTDAVYDDKGMLSFDLGSLKMAEPQAKSLVGKIGVSGRGEYMVYRGDHVTVMGKFYPARGSVVAYMSYSNLKVTGRSNSVVYDITRRFSAGLLNALPEPLGSFALGILVGQRNTLPDDVNDVLSTVGLTHIIAVSGYNLTIMIRAARKLSGKRSKFQTYVASQALIISFLLVTGMSASIVRAAIISTLSLGAWYYGRSIKPVLLILFTAAVTALWNPLYIWSDLGWYLSFLAFFGVMIVGPLVRKRLFRGEPRGLIGELVMETMCAQLTTLPLILYIFKTSSLISLPANILVVPLIPVAMLLSFIAGVAGMLIAPLAGWVSWPARWLLTYLLDVATLLSRIPNMRFLVSITLAGMLLLYAVIVFLCVVLWRKTRENAKITDSKQEKLQEQKEVEHVWTQQMVNNQTAKGSY